MSVTPVTSMSASQNNANVITNSNFFTLAAELRREMLDRVDAEPGSPVERDFYIIGDTPTGSSASWTDNPKKLSLFLGGDWFTWVPARGQIYTKPDGTQFEWDGTNFVTPGGGVGGIDFSTTEQDTGLKWIDGKTIYQKTIVIAAGPNATQATYAHGVTGIDLDSIKLVQNGSALSDTVTVPLPYVDTASVGNSVTVDFDATNVRLTSGINWSGNSGHVTIQYTKT